MGTTEGWERVQCTEAQVQACREEAAYQWHTTMGPPRQSHKGFRCCAAEAHPWHTLIGSNRAFSGVVGNYRPAIPCCCCAPVAYRNGVQQGHVLGEPLVQLLERHVDRLARLRRPQVAGQRDAQQAHRRHRRQLHWDLAPTRRPHPSQADNTRTERSNTIHLCDTTATA